LRLALRNQLSWR